MEAEKLQPRARLFFLDAEVTETAEDEAGGLDFDVGVTINVDFDKESALRIKPGTTVDTTDYNYGRITRRDLKRMVKKSDLFSISAAAGATLDLNKFSLGLSGGDLSEWIPKFEFRLATQIMTKML